MTINSEVPYWVALLKIPGIGPKRFFQIWEVVQAIGLDLADFWKLSSNKVQKLPLDSQTLNAFLQLRSQVDPQKVWTEISQRDITIVTFNSELYPNLLKQIADPPPVLFCKGTLVWNSWPLIAVVGTRHITGYGRLVTERLTTALIQSGFGIVSGGMYGVDIVAQQTAIEKEGFTVAVLGFGFDYVYPNTIEQRNFFHAVIEKGGALVSEFFPDHEPVRGKFPQRNRIVAGMSLGVLVTEAASKSGSKITAQFAAEYGREVFSVPGTITSKYSEGTKDLINNGAKLVTNVEDILAEFPQHTRPSVWAKSSIRTINFSDPNDQSLYEAFASEGESSLDDLQHLLPSMSVVELMQRLSKLELEGVIINQYGKYCLV